MPTATSTRAAAEIQNVMLSHHDISVSSLRLAREYYMEITGARIVRLV